MPDIFDEIEYEQQPAFGNRTGAPTSMGGDIFDTIELEPSPPVFSNVASIQPEAKGDIFDTLELEATTPPRDIFDTLEPGKVEIEEEATFTPSIPEGADRRTLSYLPTMAEELNSFSA